MGRREVNGEKQMKVYDAACLALEALKRVPASPLVYDAMIALGSVLTKDNFRHEMDQGPDLREPNLDYRRGFLDGMGYQRPQRTDVQQDMEPVAWGLDISFQDKIGTGSVTFKKHDDLWFVIPLYAAPPKRKWVGLTDEEIPTLAHYSERGPILLDHWETLSYARAIEAKLKEKNS